MKKLLLAGGALFLLMILLPWAPRRFAWHVVMDLDTEALFDRLWAPFLLCAGLASIGAGLFLRGRPQALVAAGIGMAGYFLWFFVDSPNILRVWHGRWQLVAFVVGMVAAPVGLVSRQQVIATLGAAALAAVLLVPVTVGEHDRIFLSIVLFEVAHPEKFMWQETAALMWWIVLALAALTTLLLWAARSRLLEHAAAATFVFWPAVLAALTGIIHIMMVAGAGVALRVPIVTFAPLVLAALGAMVTLGLAALLPEGRAWGRSHEPRGGA